MIEVCQRRANRRRASAATSGVLVAGLLVGMAVTGAPVLAGIVAGFGFVILVGLPWLSIRRETIREVRRRLDGDDPSWSAKLPVVSLRALGGRTRARADLAVTGRLSLERDSWVYRPSKATVHNLDTTAELRWARTSPVQCEDTFGLFSPGVLTFHVDGVGAIGVEARRVEAIATVSGQPATRWS